MSDEEVREAERRWRETSSAEDATALLGALERDGFRLNRAMLESLARMARLLHLHETGHDPRSEYHWLTREVEDQELLAMLGLRPSRRRRCQSSHDPPAEDWRRNSKPPGAWQCEREDDHPGDHCFMGIGWQLGGSIGPRGQTFLGETSCSGSS